MSEPLADNDEIEALLAWYVRGTLDANDRARVEAAVAREPALAASLERARAEAAATRASAEAAGKPWPFALDRLMREVASAPNRTTATEAVVSAPAQATAGKPGAGTTARVGAAGAVLGLLDRIGASLGRLSQPHLGAVAAAVALVTIVLGISHLGPGTSPDPDAPAAARPETSAAEPPRAPGAAAPSDAQRTAARDPAEAAKLRRSAEAPVTTPPPPAATGPVQPSGGPAVVAKPQAVAPPSAQVAALPTAAPASPAALAPGTYAIVSFKPQATAAQIARLLETQKFEIVEGPRAGIWRLRLSTEPLPAAEAEKLLARLKADTAVVAFAALAR